MNKYFLVFIYFAKTASVLGENLQDFSEITFDFPSFTTTPVIYKVRKHKKDGNTFHYYFQKTIAAATQ